ncbi:MAG TPA: hypothetical protein VGC41_00320, partial [Kofleriaceae bacterium]
MRWLVVGMLVACSHPPPPPPVVAQKPVHALGDLAGSWSTSDDMDWGYLLEIKPDGDFHLTIDRGKLGRCFFHATPVQATAAPIYEMEVALDECHRDRAAGPVHIAVPSFTGTEATIEIHDADHVDKRTYRKLNGAASTPG